MSPERLQIMPAWPARMTADVAAMYMGISETSFLTRYRSTGVKEGHNTLWAKAQLDAMIAKQFSLPQSPGAPAEEIDTWADL